MANPNPPIPGETDRSGPSDPDRRNDKNPS